MFAIIPITLLLVIKYW